MDESNPPLFSSPVVTEEDVDKERVRFVASSQVPGIYKLCYAYQEEPTKLYPYFDVALVFRGVTDVTADVGDDFFLVAGHSKTFTVLGTEGVGPG